MDRAKTQNNLLLILLKGAFVSVAFSLVFIFAMLKHTVLLAKYSGLYFI